MPKKEKPKFDKKEYEANVLDLLRNILDGVELRNITDLDGLEGQDRLEFLRWCSQVTMSPWFDKVFQTLLYPNIEAAALKSENYEIVTFNRATANGVSLVKEYLVKMNRRYQEEFEKKEKDFDPNVPFDKTEADQFFKV